MRPASSGVALITLTLLAPGVARAQSGSEAEAAGPVMGSVERAVARVAESQQTPLDPLVQQAGSRGVRNVAQLVVGIGMSVTGLYLVLSSYEWEKSETRARIENNVGIGLTAAGTVVGLLALNDRVHGGLAPVQGGAAGALRVSW